MSTPSIRILAPVRVVEPKQQIDDRGLAGSGVAHQRDGLPRRGRERDIAQHPGALRTVAKPDPLESHLTAHGLRQPHRIDRLQHRHRLIQQREHPLGRGHGALQQIELLREILQRLEEAAGELDERRQHARP